MVHLTVTYDGFPEFSQLGRLTFDEKIEHAVGKEASGTGYGGGRDVNFTFRTTKDAASARRRVKTLAKKLRKKFYYSIG